MSGAGRVVVVYGSAPGVGGLGHSVSAGISAAAGGAGEVFALGPRRASNSWSLPGGMPLATWLDCPPGIPHWRTAYTPLRWNSGRVQFLRDRHLGTWAAEQLQRIRPQSCYLFTQVALESLRWCRREGIPTVLDNPNGHIRNFQEVCERESRRWFGKKFRGHPTQEMVERIEEEYALADWIRVYSEWGKASMQRFGVPESKIQVLHQTVNLERFCVPTVRPPSGGPLRVCYVGSLDLRKGYVYLLRALRSIGAQQVRLRIAGATGDRANAKLLARECAGLEIEVAPGDALPVYQQSELLVIPTLEDGLPFVLVEGLACGLPVVVTHEAGAAECVRHGESGWLIPAGNAEVITAALEEALRRRAELPAMGRQARAAVESYADAAQLQRLSTWIADCSRQRFVGTREGPVRTSLSGLLEKTDVS
jgi:glycosyltransferase involved in cell wall biosynthesis